MVSGTTRAAAAARARGGRRGASSGIPPRRQPPAVVLLGAMLLVSCGATSCTGKSIKLPKAQCEAWGALYNIMKWKSPTTCSHTDPCSCGPARCNSAGTAVTGL